MTKFENIPAYLQKNGLFCLWRYETDQRGRKTKMPYDPNRPQQRSDSTKKEKFATLETAAARSSGFDGIGIGIFDNIAAIDIDHCINGGQLSAMAADIVETMDAYTEKSPSGEGLRLLFLVTSDFQYDIAKYYINNRKNGLEIYLPDMTDKYVTITGDTLRARDIVDRSDRLQPILDKYMKRPEQPKQSAPTLPVSPLDISDSDLIEKAKAAGNGAKFSELWGGGLSVYPSNSEADLALCNLLAFWTACDAGRMKSLFLQSGLNRQGGGKYRNPAHYDRYLNKTIEKAIANCGEVYTPRQNAPERPRTAETVTDDKNTVEAPKTPPAATGRAAIDEFLQIINTERYKPVKTGIDAIDDALNGGFIPQTLIFLGAEPGAGKTALATMIFESMAKAGHAGIYYNLEMSREQLLARSLARIAYTNDHSHKLNALDVLQLYNKTDRTKSIVTQAATQYKETIADNLEYNPGDVGADLDDILTNMTEQADAAIKEGKPAPNICIDYLQILTSRNREDAAAIIKRAVDGLKDYAKKYNAIVFCIMAQSRGVNARSEATLAAGRDTSAIEYSGDIQLQLIKDETNNKGKINLSITKSRFTQTKMNGDGVVFRFYGGQSYFEETAEKWNKPKKKQGRGKSSGFDDLDDDENPFIMKE